MSSDKSSIIEKAQKLAAKGQIDKAIEEWQKLIAETPNDGNIYNTIGDLHLKANHTKEAISAYLKAADAFRGAGFELKSIAVYKKIVKIDPSRMDVYEKLADVHAERGLVANAIEDYLKVAKHYAKEGDMQSSIAVYRKVANLDPKNFAVRQKIAEICQKWGLAKEAVEEYGKVLSIFKDRQMTSEAQEVIDKVLKIDPTFTEKEPSPAGETSASKEEPPAPLNEAPPKEKELSQPAQKVVEEATPIQSKPIIPEPAQEPLSLSARMEKSLQEGDWLAAEVMLEELRDQPAESFAFLSRWVAYFLEKGSHPKAFLILQKAVSLAEAENLRPESRSLIQTYLAENAEQISAHQLLGENFERSGEEGEAIQCYSKIISLLSTQRSETEAQAYYEKIKSRLPGISEDEQWRQRFEPEDNAAVVELPPEEPQEIIANEPPAEQALSDLEPVEIGRKDESSLSDPVSVGPPPVETAEEERPSAAPLQEISETTFQGHLTEADVYIKYGLNSKAIEQLVLLSELAPSREEPHVQLKELYLKEGMREKAADECLFLARLYEKAGAGEKRNAILAEMSSIDPDRQYQRDREEISVNKSKPAKAAPAGQKIGAPSDAGEVFGEINEGVEALPIEGGVSIPSQYEAVHSSETSFSESSTTEVKLAKAQAYIKNGNKEAAKSLLWKILNEDSACAEARMMLLNLQSASKENSAAPAADPAASIEPVSEGVAEEFSFEGLSQEIEEGLEDLLSDDAEEASSQEAAGALEEISLSEEEGEKEEKEEYIDLKSIFGEELSPGGNEAFDFEVPGLDDALNDLKESSLRVTDDQEIETHYNLGIAYKEMGLIPEAIKEFQLAFQGNHRFQDASSMLASCYKENGMIDTGIEILQNALEDPRCDKENALPLKYELAMLYDLQGAKDQAKALYDEIYLIDPTFRDIAAKKSDGPEQDGTNQTVPPIPESSKPKRGPDGKKKNRISYL